VTVERDPPVSSSVDARSRLAGVLDDPKRISELSDTDVSALLLRLAAFLTVVSTRHATREPRSDPAGDTLLDVNAAAERLCVSRDWVYRHGKRLPFAVRVGRKHLRFSAKGIDRWLQAHQGR
jgi:predicted DNA-binding transcriptional regulator AlpA